MKQILCLAQEPWSSSPRRTQQLLSRLHDANLLYFSPASGWFDPNLGQQGRKVRPNVRFYTLPPRFFPTSVPFSALSHTNHRLVSFIRSKMAKHHVHRPLLWTTSPEQVHLLDKLEYNGLVYDCDRNWEDFFPPEWEGRLAHMADVVFAASPYLAERLEPCSANVTLLPNGVTYPLFSNPDLSQLIDPLPHIQGPILGWSGSIREDLNLNPIFYAAYQRPNWTFLLLGPRFRHPQLEQLAQLRNVVLAGPCPLSQVPSWLNRCQVLIDLLYEDSPEDGVISTRLYEYLSTGKPIVSMLWPDQIEVFPDVVYAAHTNREFVQMCSHAMEEAPRFVTQRRQTYGEKANWSQRVTLVSQILELSGLLL